MGRLEEIEARVNKATKGPWRAGMSDMLSYDGDGDGPYKQVYVDNPDGRVHMGERLPDVVAKMYDALGADCRNNAEFAAHAREDVPWLVSEVRRLRKLVDRDGAGTDGRQGEAGRDD
jgi:hypothetical protein